MRNSKTKFCLLILVLSKKNYVMIYLVTSPAKKQKIQTETANTILLMILLQFLLINRVNVDTITESVDNIQADPALADALNVGKTGR